MSIYASFAIPPYLLIAAPVVGLAIGVGIYEYKKQKAAAAGAKGGTTVTGPTTGVKAPIGGTFKGTSIPTPSQSVTLPSGKSLPVLKLGTSTSKPVTNKAPVAIPVLGGTAGAAAAAAAAKGWPVCSPQRQRLLTAAGLPLDANCPPIPGTPNLQLAQTAAMALAPIGGPLSSPCSGTDTYTQLAVIAIGGFISNPTQTQLETLLQDLGNMPSPCSTAALNALSQYGIGLGGTPGGSNP